VNDSTSSLVADALLLGIVSLIALHTVSLARRGRLLLLDPLFSFWAGILVVYVAQPLSFRGLFLQWHPADLIDDALVWTLLGIACVICGYESNLGVRLGRRLPYAPAQLAPRKLAGAGYVLLLLGVAGYLYLFHSAGGMREWLAVGRGATDYENISAYLGGLADLLPVGVLLLLFQMHFHPSPTWKRVSLWCLAALVWWWFLYLGSRSRLIGFTIAAMGSYYLPARRSPPPVAAAVVFLGLFILGNFQEAYRDRFTDLSLHLDEINLREAQANVLPAFLGGSRAAQAETVYPGIEFNCVLSVLELVPDKVPYNYGYGYLEVFTRWIPRAFWPEKSYPQMEAVQGVLREAQLSLASVRDSDLLMGPAFTFVGHWYYVAGPLGLGLGGLLTGILFRAMRTIYDRRSSQGDTLIYVTLFGLGFSDAASTPLAWFNTLPFVLGPLAAVLYFCRVPSPRPARPYTLCIPPRLAGSSLHRA
jgi:hypothetical protein